MAREEDGKKYKWANPGEWLGDKIVNVGEDSLCEMFKRLAGAVDFDTVQEVFQDMMESDGYFEPLRGED